MKKYRNPDGSFAKGNTIGIETRFTSEKMKGNQYAKGNPPNKTTFGILDIHKDKHPCWNGGVQVMKKDCVYLFDEKSKNRRKRRPLAVWEEKNGELPKGMIIYHIDGNKHNDDIDNLRIITRAELLKLNSEVKR